MAFLARIIRILLWLVFIAWAVWLARRLFAAFSGPTATGRARPTPPPAAKRLFRDPWCGTHVSAEISHTLEEAGQVLHFCSAECRERYLAAQRRAADR